MEQIRDCAGRLTFILDPETWMVEHLYKGCKTRANLELGGSFTVEREGAVTTITRTSLSEYRVTQGKKSA